MFRLPGEKATPVIPGIEGWMLDVEYLRKEQEEIRREWRKDAFRKKGK
jgi:hypothetical protein